MTHTPGQWRVDDARHIWKHFPMAVSARKPGVHCVAVAKLPARATISGDEMLANARLIASAPAMLEALLELVAEADNPHNWNGHQAPHTYGFQLAREAIKQAQGGTP